MTMVPATVVRLVTLHTDSDESETWEKHIAFVREPAQGECVELWDGCAGLRVEEKSWRHDGELVIWLHRITLGDLPERPWDMPTEYRMKHWWRAPMAPTPETLAAGGWWRTEG